MDHLFKYSLSAINYYLPVRAAFELAFGQRTNSQHTTKSPADDIHSLGELLSQDALRQRTHRHVQFSVPDIFHNGSTRLAAAAPTDGFRAGHNPKGGTELNFADENEDEGYSNVFLSAENLVGLQVHIYALD